MNTINLTHEQNELVINLVRDRYLMLLDMAASAADCGDIHSHDQLSDEYWELGQVLKQLEA